MLLAYFLVIIAAVYVLVIISLVFLLRVLVRKQLPKALGSDVYFHLSAARAIRDNRFRVPERFPRIILPHAYSYPYFFHWLLARFSLKTLLHVERIVSPLFDTIATLAVYFFTCSILDRIVPDEQIQGYALWSALLFGVSPALLRVAAGPRAYHGTPRTLGQLFVVLFLGFQVLYSLDPHFNYMVFSIIIIALLTITSKFANQAVVFMSLGMCLLGAFQPLIAVAGGYLLSGIITRGRAVHVLKGQFMHSWFYARHLQKKYLWPHRRTFWDYLAVLSGWIRDPSSFRHGILNERYWLHLMLVFFPHFTLALIAFVAYRFSSEPGMAMLTGVLWKWIAVSSAIMLITSFKPLLFLGEPERYMENTVFLQVMLFVILFSSHPWVLWGMLLYSLIIYGLSRRKFISDYRQWSDIARDLLPLIARHDAPGKRFYGIGTFFWVLLYGTQQAEVLCHGCNVDETILPVETWNRVFGNYPYPGVPLAELVKEYNLDYVVGTDSTIALYEQTLGDKCFSTGDYKEIDSEGHFKLFNTKPEQA